MRLNIRSITIRFLAQRTSGPLTPYGLWSTQIDYFSPSTQRYQKDSSNLYWTRPESMAVLLWEGIVYVHTVSTVDAVLTIATSLSRRTKAAACFYDVAFPLTNESLNFAFISWHSASQDFYRIHPLQSVFISWQDVSQNF